MLPAPSEIAARLKVDEGSKTVLRFCHRYVDDVPWSTQATYYPAWLIEERPRLAEPGDIEEGTTRYLAASGIERRRERGHARGPSERDGSRHTAGTILNELGVDMPTIMEILRHTQISQTRRYVKGRSHLSKDAMRRMGEFFVPAPTTPIPGPTEARTEIADTRAARAQRRRRIR